MPQLRNYHQIEAVKKKRIKKNLEKNRRDGYWKKWNNLKNELNSAIEQLGHFPTQKELSTLGMGSLSHAIGRHHGGFNSVREKMGYDIISKTPNYWRVWKNIRSELESIVKENGHFPSDPELRRMGFYGMLSAMGRYYGGYSSVRERMGYKSLTKPTKYWKDWSNVENELGVLIKKLGHFPSGEELKENHLQGLLVSLSTYHKTTLSDLREKMGYEATRKPKGFWQKWENVENELKEIIHRLGHFPTNNELLEIGHSSLSVYINKYGGVNKVRKRMGYEISSIRSKDYWKSWKNVKDELEPIIKRLGHFPKKEELSNTPGFGGLSSALSEYHGGINEIRKRMGYEPSRRSPGHWKSWDNVEQKLKEVIEQLGHFPSQNDLANLHLAGLISSIRENHGGTNKVRKRMGHAILEREKNYWKNWGNVEKELNGLISKFGYFPTNPELRKNGGGSLAMAISQYHNGMNSVKEKMGYESTRKSPGYWERWENVENELKEIINRLGHFPKTRSDFSNTLYAAIQKRHGGINKVRKKMGSELLRKSNNYWKNWGNITNELDIAINKIGHFPSQNELIKMGLGSLCNALFTYHGGTNEVRKKMGYEPLTKPAGYWRDWGNVEQELNGLITKLGHFPTQKELSKIGMTSLSAAIAHHGGFPSLRKKMGYEVLSRPVDYWKDLENVKKELGILIEKIRHFPERTDLIKNGLGGLRSALKRHHKMNLSGIRETMGYGIATIKTQEQFKEFIRENPTARNLAAAAASLNGEGYEIEKVIGQIYEGKFQNDKDIHRFISENRGEIEQLTKEGLTNLGAYIGEYSLEDRAIIPILLGRALSGIPQNKMTAELENRLTRVLRHQYGPQFNFNPKATLIGIEKIVESSEGNIKEIYQRLYDHYQEVMELKGELN